MKQKRFPKWLWKLFRRRMLIAVLIIAQAAFFIYLVASGSMVSQQLSRILTVVSVGGSVHRIKAGQRCLQNALGLSDPMFSDFRWTSLSDRYLSECDKGHAQGYPKGTGKDQTALFHAR